MIDRIYRVLNDNEIEFTVEFPPNDPKDGSLTLGLHFDRDVGNKIVVNVIDNLIPTIIHECLHEILPHKEEKEICKLEINVCNILSRTQKRNIFNLWLRRVGGIRQQ